MLASSKPLLVNTCSKDTFSISLLILKMRVRPSHKGIGACSSLHVLHSDTEAVNASPMPIILVFSPGWQSILFSVLCHNDGGIEEEEEENGDVISQMIQLQSYFSFYLFQ